MSASDEEEYLEQEEEEEEELEEEEGEESEDEEEYEEEPTNNNHEDVVDDLTYDTYNLTASLYHPLRWTNSNQKEQVILEAATRAAQLLYKRLSALPTENSDTGPVTLLPSEVAVLPRTNKVPEAKPETRWEKFARERGIKKTKRDRMVYDEATGEYKPRYGYKGINKGLEDTPIVEVKDGQDPYADPWSEERAAKKDRIKRNEKNQLRNLGRFDKKKNGKKSYDPESVPGIPIELNGANGKRGKTGTRKALEVVQQSTASLGRYDEMRPGEPSRKLSGKKRSFRDNFTPFTDEQQAMKAQVRFVADKKQKKAKGVTNSLAAYEGILPDAPSLSFKKSKGRGKSAGMDMKKKAKR